MKLQPSYASSDQDDGQWSGLIMASVCAAAAFMMLLVAAVSRYMKTFRKPDPESHMTLAIKRPSEPTSLSSIRKPSAVRSPAGTQVGAGILLKKSPSPSDYKSPPGSCDASEHGPGGGGAGASTNGTNSRSSSHQSLASGGDITTTMVQRKEPEFDTRSEDLVCLPSENPEEVLGKLSFRLKYSYENSSLCVTIEKADILATAAGKSGVTVENPYIKLQLLPDKQHKVKTRVMKKTTSPVFDEDFTFYGIDPSDLKRVSLHFTLLSFDRFSRDVVIGEVIFQLDHVEFDCLDKVLNLTRNILPRRTLKDERGELLVSICYQPPASRLAIVVLKARNLPKMDLTGYCDPYVKIYLMEGNNRIAKKKTHVKKRTLNPVFNESFMFDIPQNKDLNSLHLEFVLLDYERVTKNEVVGNLIIGPKADGTGLKHWQDIQGKPRRQIAEWHKLRRCE